MRLLRVVGVVLALVLAVLSIAVAAGLFMNDRAQREAAALCTSIGVGSTEAQALALGAAAGGRHTQAGGEHRFFFQGWVFNGTQCVVHVQAGRVVSVEVASLSD